jgi:hypothetical protein
MVMQARTTFNASAAAFSQEALFAGRKWENFLLFFSVKHCAQGK